MKTNFEVLLLEGGKTFVYSLDPKAQYKVLYNFSKQGNSLIKSISEKSANIFGNSEPNMQGTSSDCLLFGTVIQKHHVICTHGVNKKTQKTPRKEIKTAEKIRLIYLKDLK